MEENKTEEVTEIPSKFKKLVEEIETMSVLDLSELVKVMEKKFGVSAAPTIAVGAPTASVGEVLLFDNSHSAASALKSFVREGDVILIKGSPFHVFIALFDRDSVVCQFIYGFCPAWILCTLRSL